MMRARGIQPGFYKNDQLAECSIEARYIFPGLWMLADRMGRLEYRPKKIKGELLPFDNADVPALLAELEANGLIKIYEADDKKFIWIPTFLSHQKPHNKEKSSSIPRHPDDENPEQFSTQDKADPNLGAGRPQPRCGQDQTQDKADPNLGTNRPALIPDSLIPDSLIPEDINSMSTPSADKQKPQSGNQQAEILPLEEDEPKAPPCPYQAIADLYHTYLPEHRRVTLMSEDRKRSIRARWAYVGHRLKERKEDDSEKARLRYFEILFKRASQSDFLTGKITDRSGKTFMADFNFFMQPSRFVDTLEGKYDNRGG